jgi:carboxyl-terminal processing protease
MFKYFLLLLCVCLLFHAAPAQSGAAALRQKSFEIVWRTVKEKHYDATFGGVDWDAARVRYEPEAARAKTDDELHALLRRMLGELKLSHFGIFPSGVQADAGDKAPKPSGDAGLELQVIDGQVVIVSVAPASGAFAAGLRPGFGVTWVESMEWAKFLPELDKRLAADGLSPGLAALYRHRAVNGSLLGNPGQKLKIGYLDAADRPATAEITLAEKTVELTPALGYMPPQEMTFTAKRLANGVGYIKFNIWLVPQMEKLRAAVREMNDAPGLIIDLRGNPGGVGTMAAGLAGMLSDKEGSLGVMKLRSGRVAFAVFPQPNAYTGPVVALIDAGSASTSEIFAAGLQETGRATIVGTRSPGAALPSLFEKLPTGALFQYAIADFQTPKGALIEGRGVIPDIVAAHTRASLLKGLDAPLVAALEYLQKQPKPVRRNSGGQERQANRK